MRAEGACWAEAHALYDYIDSAIYTSFQSTSAKKPRRLCADNEASQSSAISLPCGAGSVPHGKCHAILTQPIWTQPIACHNSSDWTRLDISQIFRIFWIFSYFFVIFEHFRSFSDVFGRLQTCLDTFGCGQVPWDPDTPGILNLVAGGSIIRAGG